MAAPIVVVDYHKGNLLSVVRGLSEVGGEASVSDDPAAIAGASGIVLPGVGSFEDAMSYMNESGQADAVREAVGRGVPEGANVYFTHSYALDDDVEDAVVATRTHYVRSFASSVWGENVYGVQFHPEKSSATGLRILTNYVDIVRGGAR